MAWEASGTPPRDAVGRLTPWTSPARPSVFLRVLGYVLKTYPSRVWREQSFSVEHICRTRKLIFKVRSEKVPTQYISIFTTKIIST